MHSFVLLESPQTLAIRLPRFILPRHQRRGKHTYRAPHPPCVHSACDIHTPSPPPTSRRVRSGTLNVTRQDLDDRSPAHLTFDPLPLILINHLYPILISSVLLASRSSCSHLPSLGVLPTITACPPLPFWCPSFFPTFSFLGHCARTFVTSSFAWPLQETHQCTRFVGPLVFAVGA
jgi:hypothetical protein